MTDTGVTGEAVLRRQWPIMAQAWRLIGPPLRPSPQDVAIFQSILDQWVGESGRAPHALILGVTPELYRLAWPRGSRVAAADRTSEMIEYVWPGPRADAHEADWRAIPREDWSLDLVLCDGGLHLLDYPDGQTALKRELARLLTPGGLVVLRLYALPAVKETSDEVLSALWAGAIPDLNCLKLRLGMALQENPSSGVKVSDVWETLRAGAPSWEPLANRLGWDLDCVRVINAYRESAARYYFLAVPDVVELFTGGGGEFELVRVAAPDSLMGDQCPTVVFRRCA